MNRPFKIIIAGGKTGGHLFPAIAAAQALEALAKELDKNISILFVGTGQKFEIETLDLYGYRHRSISARPVKGGNILSKIYSVLLVMISITQSLFILLTFRPDFVLGVGGFSSFSVVLAAWMAGIPTAIQEQNAFPGLTNRMLARFAGTIFTSFEKTESFSTNPKMENKIKFFGNPVRRENQGPRKVDPDFEKLDTGKFTILVTGGSQGAESINRAFLEAIELIGSNETMDTDSNKYKPPVLSGMNIIHQTGRNMFDAIQDQYRRLGIDALVKPFFYNMPELQTRADLMITRAGASTISEICHRGIPAILIPFPFAADDHQMFNARAVEEKGGAVTIDENALTGIRLKQTIADLMENRKKLDEMKKALKELAMPDADKKIASYILTAAGAGA